LGLPEEGRLVLSCGHLVVRKGFHYLIRALGLLRQRGYADLRLVIVGAPGIEGNYKPQLVRLTRELGLEEAVYFAGAQPNSCLNWWYSAADVFCLASTKEGWANVLLEALACGTPVVATRVWGTGEVICSPEYGVLVPPQDVEALADGLSKALSLEWDRDRLVGYAREHTWDKVAEGVYSIWQEVVAGYAG